VPSLASLTHRDLTGAIPPGCGSGSNCWRPRQMAKSLARACPGSSAVSI